MANQTEKDFLCVPDPKKKKFRMEAKNYFLTFPQCAETRETAMSNIKDVLGSKLKAAVVAQEHHADGSLHLHCLIFLHEKLRTSNPNYFDFVVLKHGNYAPIKRVSAALKYVQKEDKEAMIFGDVPSGESGLKRLKSDLAAERIRSGCSLAELATEMPGYFLSNQDRIRKFQSFCIEAKLNESLVPLPGPLPLIGLTEEQRVIVDWLNTNLFKPRTFKQLQLYIYGPANSGKTSLILALSRFYRLYEIPNGEDFCDFFENDKFKLAYIDEFRADKTIGWLNRWLQGSITTLRVKGSQVMKVQNIPTIILSNFSPHEAYSKTEEAKLETLLSRLLVVKVTNIHFPISFWDSAGKPPPNDKDEEEEPHDATPDWINPLLNDKDEEFELLPSAWDSQ